MERRRWPMWLREARRQLRAETERDRAETKQRAEAKALATGGGVVTAELVAEAARERHGHAIREPIRHRSRLIFVVPAAPLAGTATWVATSNRLTGAGVAIALVVGGVLGAVRDDGRDEEQAV